MRVWNNDDAAVLVPQCGVLGKRGLVVCMRHGGLFSANANICSRQLKLEQKTVLGKFGTSLSALPEALQAQERVGRRRERANSAFMDMDDAGLSVRGAICGRTHHPHPGGQAEPRRSAQRQMKMARSLMLRK